MQNIHILIAEDEKKIADALKQGLEENGFSVQVAYDGNIALKIFRSQPHQLIIADINLPGMNGYCLLYTSDAADDLLCVDLGGRRTITKQ